MTTTKNTFISTENVRYMAYVEPGKIRRFLKSLTQLDFNLKNYEIYCKEGPTGVYGYERYDIIDPRELRETIDRNMGFVCRTLRSLQSDSVHHGRPLYPATLKLSNSALIRVAREWAENIISGQQLEEFLQELAREREERKRTLREMGY